MKNLRKNFQIGFLIIMSLFLANCSSSSDKLFDDFDDKSQLATPHTYDIKLTKGAETIHYTGSVNTGSSWIVEGENGETGKEFQVISLLIQDGSLRIDGTFSFDEKGSVVPFDELYEEDKEGDEGFNSAIVISDLDKGSFFASMTGKPMISNLKKQNISITVEGGKVNPISYTLKFSGNFGRSSEDDIYSATGTIVVSPYKQ